MGTRFSRLWKSFASAVSAEGVANAAEKVFDLAETLSDQENKDNAQIKQLVEKIPTLLEALNSPLGQVVKSTVPFLPIATGLIQFAIAINKKEPTVGETVAIISQVAYLKSIRETFASQSIFTDDLSQDSQEVKKKLNKLAELEINYQEATLALVYFHESKIAEAFNEVLSAKLETTGIAQAEVKTWVNKVALNTQQYIAQALADAGDEIAVVRRILDWYQAGGKEEFVKRQSINYYLEDKIKKLPEDFVFQEKFSYRDVYVPLRAIELDVNGKEVNDATNFVLEEWAQEFITNSKQSGKIIFIQAGAGRGKSVFCRMFADWVRQNLHPLLTPIVIRLRDIEQFEQSFEKTLSDALSKCDFVSNDPGWLTDSSTQYLFLLDAFDELRMEGRAGGGIERFIRQVGLFQKDFQGKETGHRVIMTGRPIALQGISSLPANLSRVKLLPMDDDIQQQWLVKWQQVVIPDNPDAARLETEKFKSFLETDQCPTEVKDELAREPLLLYLLAKLHREQAIKQADFEQAENSTQAKILIYEKSLEWVLTEQRKDEFFTNLQQQITGLHTDNLQRILTEAGLCVVQSGGEYARVEMIEQRLEKDDSDAAGMIKELRKKSGEKALNTALGAFYIRPAGGNQGGGVEFYHKSFGEFLCARRFEESIERWTTLVKIGRQQQWLINKEQLAREIYDLLGYGGLSWEIVEYLRGLLLKSEQFLPVELFQRLFDFYWRWCDGEFIDAEGTTLPQTKMRELKKQLPARDNYLGQRQVDVYAGLNIMILLLELHRYGQSQPEDLKQKLTFYPCGKPNADGQLKDATLLKRLFSYGDCFGDGVFRDTLRRFLEGANLYGSNLYGTNLYSSNLSGANLNGASLDGAKLLGATLDGANLSGTSLDDANLYGASLSCANLSGASLNGATLDDSNLSGANLSGANLSGAFLNGASLEGANLSGVNLSGVNLSGVNLFGADLFGADLFGANLRNISWNEATNWSGVRGLDQAINVPEALKQQLSL